MRALIAALIAATLLASNPIFSLFTPILNVKVLVENRVRYSLGYDALTGAYVSSASLSTSGSDIISVTVFYSIDSPGYYVKSASIRDESGGLIASGSSCSFDSPGEASVTISLGPVPIDSAAFVEATIKGVDACP